MEVRMMQRKEVCVVLGVSSSSLHRGIVNGKFPKPYRTGQNSVRWKSNEIQEIIDHLQVAEPVSVAPDCATRGRRKSIIKRE